MNIGIFDSGVGGLTIVREVVRALPHYNYIYVGDNARVPYGGRSSEAIYHFTRQAVDFLMRQNCALVIVACNTAGAVSLRRIQQEYLPQYYPDRRVLGVVRPTVEAVYEASYKRVGVIATHATVLSNSFVAELKKLSPSTTVFQLPTPLLVPFIEEGEVDNRAFQLLIAQYLRFFRNKNIDSLILGCTHYGLIKKQISTIIDVPVIAQGPIVAQKLRNYLVHHPEIDSQLAKKKMRRLAVTDMHARYQKLIYQFLGNSLSHRFSFELVRIE